MNHQNICGGQKVALWSQFLFKVFIFSRKGFSAALTVLEVAL